MGVAVKNTINYKPGNRKRSKVLRQPLGTISGISDSFINSRIQAVRMCRYYLKDRHDQLSNLTTFESLIEGIKALDTVLAECEIELRRTALDEFSPWELTTYIDATVVPDLDDCVSECAPSVSGATLRSTAGSDALHLMERMWEEITSFVPDLQDALRSVWENHRLLQPDWRRQFESEVRSLKHSEPIAPSAPRYPLVFQGELAVEDDAFSCNVDRIILKGEHDISLQMTGVDESGSHKAEGQFVFENGSWRTHEFRLRYATYSSDTPAKFRIEALRLSPDQKKLDLRCDWDLAGDKFDLGGTLEPFVK
jgi:hypothetical protein